MIIYKLSPEPKPVGSYNKGIVKIGGIKKEMSEEEVMKRFNTGYFRLGL